MFIARLCALVLFVFSGLLNSNCTMIDIQEKQYLPHQRTARQSNSRPILNGILFLLATNLIAKGIVGLHAYTPPITSMSNGLQGSVYVSFGRPTQPPAQHQQFLPYSYDPYPQTNTYWNPMSNPIPNTMPYPTTTPKSQPIQQHQIINIHDTPFEEMTDAQYQEYSINRPGHHIVIDKYLPKDVDIGQLPAKVRTIIPKRAANTPKQQKEDVVIKRETEKNEENIIKKQKVKPALELFKFQPQQYNLINKLAHLKRQVSTEIDKNKGTTDLTKSDVEAIGSTDKYEGDMLARQAAATTLPPAVPTTPTTAATTPSTTAPTPAATTPTTSTRAATTTPVPLPTTTANATGNDTGYYYGYGPYTGNENISLTTLPPGATFNATTNETIGNATVFPEYNYPASNYGPSNGNENISITYGPPSYNNYGQNQPFYSSQVDHYLDGNNNRRSEYDHRHYDNNNNNYDGYYQNNNEYQNNQYHSQVQQFNDEANKFYNKYDYHYPYYNNYLGK